MARTNRKAALAAQQQQQQQARATVDSLDDLNLDDMFNEGDGFFDGLDIDLDGIGEIPNAASKKREEINKEAAKLHSASAPATEEPATETTARRKTKRKIKAPPPPDVDDEDFEAPKKKRRVSKASAKKTKSSKGSTSKVLSTMPPPASRASVDPTNAAGLSAGGRNQKIGMQGQALLRQASGSSAVSMSASNFSRASSGTSSEGPWTQQETTYCGLLPSNTEFYPFMPTVPPEASLNKIHRNPVFTSIHSAMSATAGPTTTPSNTSETDGLYRLLSADLEQLGSDRNTTANDQRRANLGHAIANARVSVSQADKSQLLKSLRSICFLLKRQYDFLNQSNANMERWCQDTFSPQDFQAGFGHPPSARRGSQSVSALPYRAGSLLTTIRSPVIRVKVRCAGFKAPLKGSLVAHIGLSNGALPLSRGEMPRTALTKKRKLSSVTDIDRSSMSGSSVQDTVFKEVSYVDMKPFQRRHRVADMVAQRAQNLDLQIRESREKHRRSIERQRAEQQKVVDDDEIVSLNTMTMWKWLEKSPHFSAYSEADLRDALEHIWEPELDDTDLLTKPAEIISSQLLKEGSDTTKRPDIHPGDSVFLRLQALLVDEGSDESEDEEADTWMVDKNDGSKEGGPREEPSFGESTVLDLSGFSLEERTLLHLRAVGLIDDIRALAKQTPLAEKDDESIAKNRADGNGESTMLDRTVYEETDENDIDSVILAMQAELQDQRRVNNSRLGFLETTTKSHLESIRESKKREDENALMVARYNQLLKKQKEAKKNARQKPSKDDSDWVPW